MTRHPRDPNPDPPGGRAAERLRQFLDERFREGDRPTDPSKPTDEDSARDATPEEGEDEAADPGGGG